MRDHFEPVLLGRGFDLRYKFKVHAHKLSKKYWWRRRELVYLIALILNSLLCYIAATNAQTDRKAVSEYVWGTRGFL